MKGKTIKILEENVRECLYDLGAGRDFLNRTPKALDIKENVDKLDLIKIKNVCSPKDSIKKVRRQALD